MHDELIGKVLGGCRVVSRLGKGGMSTIYLAQQESIGRDVALKTLSPMLLGDETFMRRFSHEVEMTARLQHPHIIPIFDFGQDENLPFIVMAYIPGGSLEDLMTQGPVPIHDIPRLVSQIAEALDYGHAQGVIHRDVKPANVLLDRMRNAILTDFGIAKLVTETDQISLESIIGTFAYLPPESAKNSAVLTPAADVYSLGVTIFQMLTGRLPFNEDTTAKLMLAHIHNPVPLVSEMDNDLPPALDAILQKALAKAPEDRYHTCIGLATDLHAVLAGDVPHIARAEPPPTVVGDVAIPNVPNLEHAVAKALDQVVKVNLSSGGNGSGMIIAGNRIITCLHVVDGEPGVYIRLRTGEQIEADVIAIANRQDLALLHLRSEPESLNPDQVDGIVHTAPVLDPGEPLAAIGHPLGLDWSVTGGHYNAIRQPGEEPLPKFGINLDTPLVQVDVTINAGNSGGPIIDQEGNLVGIADSIINPAIANNIGFAIASETVWAFVDEHASDSEALVAYNCRHHHAPGETFCPLTGRPVKPLDPVPMPDPNNLRYSCGHLHPPGTVHCPLTGKPVTVEPGAEAGRVDSAHDRPSVSVTCTNCGRTYDAALTHCPYCGKPQHH